MRDLKLRDRVLALALAGSVSLSGCSFANVKDESVEPVFEKIETVEEEPESIGYTECVERAIEEAKNTLAEAVQEALTKERLAVVGTTTVNVREEASTESNKIGYLGKGSKLDYLGEEGEFFKVKFPDGRIGYVSSDYSYVRTEKEVLKDIQQMFYCTSDITLIEKDTNEERIIPKYELVKVYKDNDGEIFVEADGYVGTITFDNVEELFGTFVVIDLGDQLVYVYQDNKLVYTCPVITGRPGDETPAGFYTVFEESFNRDLVGPTWCSYVDYMMKFVRGIGLHDAEYHTNEDGKKHGWKSPDDWTQDMHFKKGSHGCCNLKNKDAETLSNEYVDIGTKVLVKH